MTDGRASPRLWTPLPVSTSNAAGRHASIPSASVFGAPAGGCRLPESPLLFFSDVCGSELRRAFDRTVCTLPVCIVRISLRRRHWRTLRRRFYRPLGAVTQRPSSRHPPDGYPGCSSAVIFLGPRQSPRRKTFVALRQPCSRRSIMIRNPQERYRSGVDSDMCGGCRRRRSCRRCRSCMSCGSCGGCRAAGTVEAVGSVRAAA